MNFGDKPAPNGLKIIRPIIRVTTSVTSVGRGYQQEKLHSTTSYREVETPHYDMYLLILPLPVGAAMGRREAELSPLNPELVKSLTN